MLWFMLEHQLGCTAKMIEEFEEICPEKIKQKFSVRENEWLVAQNSRLLLENGIVPGTCLWWMILYPDIFLLHSRTFSRRVESIKETASVQDLRFLEKQFFVEARVPLLEGMADPDIGRWAKSLQNAYLDWEEYLREETEEEKKKWDDCRKNVWGVYKPFYEYLTVLIKETGEESKISFAEWNQEELTVEPAKESVADVSIQNEAVEKLPVPYDGEEPFVFISYSHEDTAEVFPIIRRLQDAGYRVWFDKGIKGGVEWAKEIAKRIRMCGCFISFVSPDFVQSEHCQDEFQWAKNKADHSFMVFLQETELEDWMDMQSGRWQRLYKHKETEEQFYQKLFQFKGLEGCRNQIASRKEKDIEFFDKVFWGTYAEDAWAVCKDFADGTEGLRHVYIHGDSTSDKMHLKHGVQNLMQEEILSVRAERWIDDLIRAILNKEQQAYRDTFMGCECLIMDDLEFFLGKTAAQEELYRILKDRFEEGKPYLLFSTEDLTKNTDMYRPLLNLLKAGAVVPV